MAKMQGFFSFIIAFSSLSVSSAPLPLASRLQKQVESSRLRADNLGLVIADAEGAVVYQLNAEKKFIPASLTKIVTAAATLEKLPVGHQFLTEVKAAAGSISGETLKGNLYLRGGGDAGFVSESMWFLVNEFIRSGVKVVEGDLIVDDSRFDATRFDASRDQERVDRAYDSPIGAMTFNWSAVNVFVRPGLKAGDPARVFVDPDNRYFTVVNQARTSGAKDAVKIEVRNSTVGKGTRRSSVDKGAGDDKLPPHEEIVVSGSIPVGGPEFVSYKSVTQPEIWAGYNLVEFLRQRGVTVRGQVRSGEAPKKSEILALYKSRPVQEHVAGMMKFSNNYIAEILTKNLGAELRGTPGTMANGVEVLKTYLHEKGLKDAELYNPSGLSRKNRFRPTDLLKVLNDVKRDFRLYPEYLASLPIAGIDGTLRRRIGAKSAGQVRAKTGLLSGVAGLGGYVSDNSGHLYSFVFLFNGGVDETYKSKDLFDKLVLELLRAEP